MKWLQVASLCAVPLALASALQAEVNGKRNGVHVEAEGSSGTKGSSKHQKGDSSTTTEIIIIWVNNGGGSPTSTINSAMAVSTAAAAAAATHSVTVGGAAGLVYTPNTIEAAVGDMVVFTFESQNHTVTQSAFTTPCEKLAGGMDSGFVPNVNNSVVPAPQMGMQVTVATPIWFYCKQKGHCGKGMTFSINPTANKTQAMFEQMAIAQNGTSTSTGTMGTSSAASAASVAAVPSTDTGASTSASSNNSGSVSSGSGSVSSGTGSLNSAGACDCSCLCGVANFPSAVQGQNAFGGMSGAMPAGARIMRR